VSRGVEGRRLVGLAWAAALTFAIVGCTALALGQQRKDLANLVDELPRPSSVALTDCESIPVFAGPGGAGSLIASCYSVAGGGDSGDVRSFVESIAEALGDGAAPEWSCEAVGRYDVFCSTVVPMGQGTAPGARFIVDFESEEVPRELPESFESDIYIAIALAEEVP